MATNNIQSMNILVFTYLISQLFMTTDVWRETRKTMMTFTLDVVSNQVYGVDLPQGLQHESAQVSEDKFPMKKDEVTLDWCA